MFTSSDPSYGRSNRDGVEEAAEELLAACQRDLLHLESPVEQRLAKELARDRFWAISALIYVCRNKKHAKETQLRITGGAPLAISMGDVCRMGGIPSLQTVSTMLGTVNVSVKRGRAIFPDVVRADGGKMWPGFCPNCRNAHSKPPRTQSRALKRRLNRIWEGRSARAYGSSVVLPPEVYERQERSDPVADEKRA